jgi:cytochrome oxidase Cu insertion factor (SCO1/SenC/PrrC family)
MTAESPATDASPARTRRRGRTQALLVLLVCAMPVLLGTLIFYLSPPTGRTNYGQLLTPAPLALDARLESGALFDRDQIDGRFWLVSVDTTPCGDTCRDKLLLMRQMKLAQGKDSGRLERLWIVPGDQPAEAPEAILAGVRVARVAAGDDWRKAFPDADPTRRLYVVDPLGNLMMSFPFPPEEKRMLRDIEKLLRINSWSRG